MSDSIDTGSEPTDGSSLPELAAAESRRRTSKTSEPGNGAESQDCGALPRLLSAPLPTVITWTVEGCLRQLFKEPTYLECPIWPPDAFAAVSYILELTGSYRVAVTSAWPPTNESLEDWSIRMHEIGVNWLASRRPPSEVMDWWNEIIQNKHVELTAITERVEDHRRLIVALLQISAVADECFSGINMPGSTDFNMTDKESFALRASTSLKSSNNWGDKVEPSVMKVIPKVQTPQVGFNLRSLSHNIATWRNPEVAPKWMTLPGLNKSSKTLNLLLMPWPYTISPVRFSQAGKPCITMPDTFQFFHYEPEQVDPAALANKVSSLIESSKATLPTIDAVVFPELALSEQSFEHLARYLAQKEIILIAGVSKAGENGAPGTNSARISFPFPAGSPEPYAPSEQFKHHRWRIDRNQIVQYGLGGALGTDCMWWEHIELSCREVYFFQLDYWLTASVLICEDLARQDPVSTLVRAVGPNLVIALLLDGPQCKGRWPDRYASVLADDPGSSVLTFTSIGMANQSRPKSMWNQPLEKCNTIGLWRDSVEGTNEISLEDDSAAVAITLNAVTEKQFTADGREAEYPRHALILSGVHQLKGSRTL